MQLILSYVIIWMCTIGVEGLGFSSRMGLECSDWIIIDCSAIQACHYLNSKAPVQK